MRTIDDDVRRFSIQRVTRCMEFLQFGQRIFNVQQRAVSIMSRALIQQSRRNIEVDHPAGVVQTTTIFRIDHHPATGCQNQIAPGRQIMDSLRFTTAKPLFTFDLENRRNRNPRSFDNFMVRIEKLPRQALGQHAPNGRFPRSHQAD